VIGINYFPLFDLSNMFQQRNRVTETRMKNFIRIKQTLRVIVLLALNLLLFQTASVSSNKATVERTSPAGTEVDDMDPSHYFGVLPPGTIIIEKQTDPDGAPQSFEFTTDYGSNFSLADGETNNSGPLTPGTYSVSEINLPAGWSPIGATCDDGSDPSAIGLDAGETVTCTFINTGGDAKVGSKTASDSNPNTGDEITYTILVKNIGPGKATGVVLSDTLPAGVAYVPGSITFDGKARTDADDADNADFDETASNAVTVNIGDMKVGKRHTIRFDVTVDNNSGGRRIENGATVTSDVDVDPSNNSKIVKIKVNAAPVADPDSKMTDEDTPVDIDVTANDTDADGVIDKNTVMITKAPTNGSITNINDTTGVVTYSPNANFNGTDTFKYTVKDNDGVISNQTTVSITVRAVNDPPEVTAPEQLDTDEDVKLTIDSDGISVADVDAGNNQIRVTMEVQNGLMSLNSTDGLDFVDGDGLDDARIKFFATLNTTNIVLTDLLYCPDPDFTGVDSLMIKVSDQGHRGPGIKADTVFVIINVNPVNDAPVVKAAEADTLEEDGELLVDWISVEDADVSDNDIQATVSVQHGSLSLARTSGLQFAAGSGLGNATVIFSGSLADVNAAFETMIYRPADHYYGVDELVAVIQDNGHTGLGGSQSDTASIAIYVTSVDDAPLAASDQVTADEDEPLTINVVLNDTDLDGSINASSVEITRQPENGSLANNNDGTITYIPDENFGGSDSFSYTVLDNAGLISNEAVVTVMVTAINDLPVAVLDEANTEEDSPLIINVLGNDTDTDGHTLTTAGTITDGGENWNRQSSGTDSEIHAVVLRDLRAATAVGEDGLILHTTDGGESWSEQNSGVSHTLRDVHFVHGYNAGTAVGDFGTILHTTDGGANWDVQSSGTTNRLWAVHFSDNSNGTAVGDGGIILRTNDGATWTAQNSATSERLWAVNFVDDNIGVAVGDVGTILHTGDGGQNWTAQNSGTGSELRGIAMLDANNGIAVGSSGAILSTTDGGQTWIAQNSGVSTTLAAVAFVDETTCVAVGFGGTILRSGDGGQTWTAHNPSTEFIPSTSLGTGSGTGVTFRDVSVAGRATVTVVGSGGSILRIEGTNGNVTINPDGTIIYTPDANFSGNDSFDYIISDGFGGSDTTTVTVTVNPVNDQPLALDDAATTDGNAPVVIAALQNDSDPDGDNLTITSVSQPANGTAVINQDGTITYTANAGFSGYDSFTYTISDGQGETAAASVNAKINAVAHMGYDVTLTPADETTGESPVSLTFSEVTQAGTTSLTTGSVGADPPERFKLGDLPIYYDISTTAVYAGIIAIAIAYDEINFVDESSLRLLQFIDGGSEDITTLLDTDANIIYGEVASLSPFAVVGVENTAPDAVNDQIDTPEDSQVTIPVLVNDSDADGDALTLQSVESDGSPGTVGINTEAGNIIYTPQPDFNGTVSFGYTVVDAYGAAASGTVTVNMTAVNDPPVLTAIESLAFPEDSLYTIAFDDLVQDVDNSADEISWTTEVQDSGTENNRLTVQIDTSSHMAIFRGARNFFGSDIPVKFSVSDPRGLSAAHTMKVTVLPVNDAPAPFSRLAPVDGISIMPDSIQFVWSAAKDVDHDRTSYTLKLFFGTKRIYFTTFDTTLYVDLRQLQLPQRTSSISWTVEASDQQAVTGVSNGIGTFDLDVATGVGDKLVGVPTEYFVDQNYPNPFNPSTTIRFGLPANGHVMLRVFNLLGQRVATLVDEQKLAGNYELQWQAGDVPTGAYFYRIQVTGAAKDGKSTFVETRKMYLIK
jgi:uncharacterized repeat protein (TIGR01451 family)